MVSHQRRYVLAAAGRVDGAAAALEEAIGTYDRKGVIPLVRHTCQLLDTLAR